MRYRRNSLRLTGYDYTRNGLYFVTINVQGRECLFGGIKNNHMFLNNAGKMINKWWLKLMDKYTTIDLDVYTIMPNHIHGIICIVGADPRVCPERQEHKVCHISTEKIKNCSKKVILGAHMGAPIHGSNVSLSKMIQWFKTMTTNEYIQNVKCSNWKPFYNKLWQRSYYDRIIRNEQEYYAIRKYIINNPSNWNK
jgi:putative transposase